ncbi:replication factor-A carboxy-terminal domain protein [Trifolium pratense]|uniref:Replication factor-A carboxy-terminal domain protein n=1 Tax=Trifolium pratense TaxID=57577 RepID=A0A2K3NHT9_TRIPR|nr:replication factor-A carboxy-terminal domain protein [Trifolium pratense]
MFVLHNYIVYGGMVVELVTLKCYNKDACNGTSSSTWGKIVRVLSGKIVEDFCKLFLVSCIGLPIIVIQFVKISVVEGDVCVHSIESVSRVLLNPPIAEVVKFKMTMSMGGSMSPVFYGGRNSIVRVSEEIEGLFHVDQWWYPVFHCGTFLTICSGYYFCDNCHVTVFSVTSKHTLQIAVGDGTSIVLLQMFDHLLSGISAINYGDLGIGYALGPDGCMILKGKEVLLIVKKVPHFGDVSDDFVEVVRITEDHELILQFHLNGKFFTPTKSIVKSAFVGVTPYLNNNGLISCVVDDVVTGKKPIENDPFQFLLISPGVPPPINKKLFDGDSTESSSSNVKNW